MNHSRFRSRYRRSVAIATAVVLASALASVDLLSQVRRTTSYSTFVDPNQLRLITQTFTRGGIFSVAGGVVFQGRARFLLESGQSRKPIASTEIGIVERSEGMYLIHGMEQFKLEAHRGLACPLGRFVLRGGTIAYSIPEAEDRLRLTYAGLVNVAGGGWVAKEFANTPIETLMESTDFADTVNLPRPLENQLIRALNAANANRREVEAGSYINADSQVTYQVYLMSGKKRAEVAGVPLRYHWNRASDGSALVKAVEAFDQNWPSGSRLTSFSNQDDENTQYDTVSVYQTAGIFRELHNANPAQFRLFVTSACSK